MGKGLIIKGADFSQNGIRVYYNPLLGITTQEFNAAASITSTGSDLHPYMFSDQLSVFSSVISDSKPIFGIRIKAAQEGIIPIYKRTFISDIKENTQISPVHVDDLVVTQDMVGNIVDLMFSESIILSDGEKLVFGNKNNLDMTAKWYYDSGNYPNLCLFLTRVWQVSTAPLTIDYLI